MIEPTGYLSIVLHAHLPFIRHPEHPVFLEENWLFEAITDCYVPLLQTFAGLERDGVPGRLAMSITPPLAAMLTDELLMDRYENHLRGLVQLAHREIERTQHEPARHRLAHMYRERFEGTLHAFLHEYGRDLLAQFRRWQDAGRIEIIASAATHAYLPLLNPRLPGAATQIDIGIEAYRRAFGRDPQGFWLPECGYAPPLDEILASRGIRWFIVESHALFHARPRPRFGIHGPIFCPGGCGLGGSSQGDSGPSDLRSDVGGFGLGVSRPSDLRSDGLGGSGPGDFGSGDPGSGNGGTGGTNVGAGTLIAAFARDTESSKQVWSATEGYPGDFDYRDFYRDIGYDLDYEYVRPWLKSDERGHTGIKYYRITGTGDYKELYNPEAAVDKAAQHAGNFMFNRELQIRHLRAAMDRPPIVVAPYDAELFGHWWFEGPRWLDILIRKIAYDQDTIELITPGDYLARHHGVAAARHPDGAPAWHPDGAPAWHPDGAPIRHPDGAPVRRLDGTPTRHPGGAPVRHLDSAPTRHPGGAPVRHLDSAPTRHPDGAPVRHLDGDVARPSTSSWGYGGYSEVWLNESNDWIYRHLHEAERRLHSLTAGMTGARSPDDSDARALTQAWRELLLAQSSDWAFIMSSDTHVPYAVRRTREHIANCRRLCEQLESGSVDEGFLSDLESRHNIFPWLGESVLTAQDASTVQDRSRPVAASIR